MADENDGDFEAVSGMADRLGLKGRERNKYIDQHMTGLGYRMQPTYVPADDEDDDDGDDRFFGSRRRRARDDDDDDRSTRRNRGNRPRGDSWYN
jgi:hypothetical protein